MIDVIIFYGGGGDLIEINKFFYFYVSIVRVYNKLCLHGNQIRVQKHIICFACKSKFHVRTCYNFKIEQLRPNNTFILSITVLHNSFFKLIHTNFHILYKINHSIVVYVKNNSMDTELSSHLVFTSFFPTEFGIGGENRVWRFFPGKPSQYN